MTTYIVLRQDVQKTSDNLDVGTTAWRIENSNVPAVNHLAAIRLACKTDNAPAGTYVAIPTRSFKPVQVSAVQTTVLKLDPT